MYKRSRIILIVLMLLISGAPAFSAEPQVLQSERPFSVLDFSGPQMRELYYVTIRDMDAQLMAISTGQIDVLSDIFRPMDVRRLAESEMVDLSLASTFHAFFITFNTRRFPWDQLDLRLAASKVVNRRQWTRDLFAGFAEPLATFLPHVSPYYEPDVEILPYGVEAARQFLADAGWTWNRSGWLVAPDGREVPPTRIFCPPSTVAATSTEIAHLMAEGLRAIGMPVEAEPMDFQTMIARIRVRDFDACTNAWNMGRNPTSLFAFYHSSMDVEGGFNMSGIADPELDAVLYNLRHAPDRQAAREFASEAQKILSRLMPVIPLYSRYSISAIRSGWDGVFTTDRVTSDNTFTLISMAPEDGVERPIFWSIPDEIRTLNPLVSSTAYDWTVLGAIYNFLISVNPYTFEDTPWLAESWSIHTEPDGTVLSFTLRPDLEWHDGRPFTAEDVAFSLEFIRDNRVPRFYDNVRDIVSTEVEDRTVRVRMGTTSYWHLSNIGGMLILPRHILENVQDWRTWQPTNNPHKALDGTIMTELIGSGPFVFRESRTGEFVHMTRNERFFLYEGNRSTGALAAPGLQRR